MQIPQDSDLDSYCLRHLEYLGLHAEKDVTFGTIIVKHHPSGNKFQYGDTHYDTAKEVVSRMDHASKVTMYKALTLVFRVGDRVLEMKEDPPGHMVRFYNVFGEESQIIDYKVPEKVAYHCLLRALETESKLEKMEKKLEWLEDFVKGAFGAVPGQTDYLSAKEDFENRQSIQKVQSGLDSK